MTGDTPEDTPEFTRDAELGAMRRADLDGSPAAASASSAMPPPVPLTMFEQFMRLDAWRKAAVTRLRRPALRVVSNGDSDAT